jgi:hypothetical protein
MYIVPYACVSKTIHGRTIHSINVLVQGGTTLWEETSDPITALESNDIYSHTTMQEGTDYYYAQVDTTRTNMDSMFNWTEMPLSDKDTLGWRTFFYISDESNSQPWITVPLSAYPQPIQKVLNTILKAHCV